MRDAPYISDLWNMGGPFNAHTVVTVQDPWSTSDPAVRNGDEDHVIHPTSAFVGIRGGRGLPVRWFQKADNSQSETEIPNIRQVEIDRSIETDAATCTITLDNQWMYNNGAVPEEHLDEGNRHLKGYFTPGRGVYPDAQARWGQETNEWEGVLVPNALIRTYQGFDGHDKTLQECLDDGNLILTGMWLIDEVRVGTNGDLTIQARDMAKLLIDQQLFTPLVPAGRYPLHYNRWAFDNFAVHAGSKHTSTTTTTNVTKGDKRATYRDSSVDRWYGAGTTLHGHRGRDSLDGNLSTFYLGEGNAGPDRAFATTWIEYNCGEFIDAVWLYPWAGNYEMYVSIYENGKWQGANTVPYDPSELYGTQPTVVDTGADIPYVKKFGVAWEKGQEYKLDRFYKAERVRVSFRHLAYSGIGQWYYRAGVREFKTRASSTTTVSNTTSGVTLNPFFFAFDNHPVSGYLTGSSLWQIDAFGDARRQTAVGASSTGDPLVQVRFTPTALGYYALDLKGRVLAFGDAVHYGDPKTDGFQWVTDDDGALDIAVTASGLGYYVITSRSGVFAYGDAVDYTQPTYTGTSGFLSIDTHPTGVGYWAMDGNGKVTARGDCVDYGDYSETSLSFDRLSDIFEIGAVSIRATNTGLGYWILTNSGRIQGRGDAQDFGQVQTPLTESQLTFTTTWNRLITTANDDGYGILRGDGTIAYWGNFDPYGNPKPGSTGQIRTDGNYKDYSDIIKDLALWAGFTLYDPTITSQDEVSVYGNIESTGSYSSEPLPDETFDKRPVIDAMTDLKEAVGYVLFVDDEGGFRFESPNFWSLGNFIQSTGERVEEIPEIDEKVNLFDYAASHNDESLRSLIIISSEDPTEAGDTTITTKIVPQTAQGLKGILKPAMWVNGWFQQADEQKIMAELIALHIWFAQRLGQVSCVANPCIQINDQVRVYERTTSEVFVHYVRGVNSSHNLETGEYTMTLTTHWLGTGDDWAITDDPAYIDDPVHYVISPFTLERLRNGTMPEDELDTVSPLTDPPIVRPDPSVGVGDPAGGSGSEVPPTADPGTFEFGFPVYTQAEIDAWSTSDPEYTALAASGAASLAITPQVYGTQISSVEREVMKDQSGYAKVQAVLWAADGNSARRDLVVAYLDEFRSVTSFQTDVQESYRLRTGWAATNLCQAAAIIGYDDADFKTFLTDVCYPIMDWTTNPNWHASFADSKLAIAAYVGSAALWADAKAYFYERVEQSIYHSTYDLGYVNPMHTEDNGSATRLHSPPGTTNLSRTVSHWGYNGAAPQVDSSLVAEYPGGTPFDDGVNAERRRDLGHVSMGMGAWMHAARTILAQNDTLEQHAYDRILAGYEYHAARVLSYVDTSTIPAPVPVNGAGSADWHQGWYGAVKLFAGDTPADVTTLLTRSTINTYSAGGTNHLVAERFADG